MKTPASSASFKELIKYLLIFLMLTITGAVYYLINSHHFSSPELPPITASGFVSLQGKQFMVENKPFTPVVLNYIVQLQTDGKELWPSSARDYGQGNKFRYTDKDSCLREIKNELLWMKEFGFNTVRVVGIGELGIVDKIIGILDVKAFFGNNRDTTFRMTDSLSYATYLQAVDLLVQTAREADMRIIFTTRIFRDVRNTEDHLKELLTKFRNEPTIMAYDLFNEPLYFDSLRRDKDEVYAITKGWKKIVTVYAPKQLMTIGLAGIREVYEWDPNVVSCDFISFHPYEYEPEQVRNEMYWYSKYVNKPWIIGETSIPSDNDSVPYADQLSFAQKTIRQAFNCGASGYSWWQFRDVDWGKFHADFMGIVNRKGTTTTANGSILNGTLKPVAEAFQNMNVSANGPCECMNNYYNYSSLNQYRLKGKAVDSENKPIEGAVIQGWNEDWSFSYHTISHADGSFELYTTFPIFHWKVSFPGYTSLGREINGNVAEKAGDGIPELNINDVPLQRLTFLGL